MEWNCYHFYCAVNENKQRGIALATSQNCKSSISFPIFEKTNLSFLNLFYSSKTLNIYKSKRFIYY